MGDTHVSITNARFKITGSRVVTFKTLKKSAYDIEIKKEYYFGSNISFSSHVSSLYVTKFLNIIFKLVNSTDRDFYRKSRLLLVNLSIKSLLKYIK